MGSTSFDSFFLPLFQGFGVSFLAMAAGHTLLVAAARFWHRLVDVDCQPWT
jgi:hypothetical protein